MGIGPLESKAADTSCFNVNQGQCLRISPTASCCAA